MSQLFIFVVFSTLYLITNIAFCDRCCQINLRPLPNYKLIKTNVRSNDLILSRTIVRSVNECRDFALTKKALAFNYGIESKRNGFISTQLRKATFRCTTQYNNITKIESNILFINTAWHLNTRSKQRKWTIKVCQALQCPEVHNFTVLQKDKNYKYYSMYPSYIPSGSNFTLICIPKTGVFVMSNNYLNYSQAQHSCQKMNSTLAHIISEERTDGLAKYISENTPTFVGLSNRDHQKIWKNEFGKFLNSFLPQCLREKPFLDEPLSCFKYRAWGKGEPSHSRGCVAITKSPKSEDSYFWKVVPCDSLLHFICEISPIQQSLRN